MYPSSLSNALGVLVCTVLAYRIYNHVRTRARMAQMASEWGCGPTKNWRNKDPLLGLDILYNAIVYLKAHKVLEFGAERFRTLNARTMRFDFMGKTLIATMEPEIVKSVLATNFDCWELGSERKEALAPFLGEGIFVTNGEAWRHSREILRPSFTKGRIGGTQRFEPHVRNLLARIPGDPVSTVDLQPLFFDLTMDVATEFLLGKGTHCLLGQVEKADDLPAGAVTVDQFLQAFWYCQNSINSIQGGGDESSSGILALILAFLPDPKLKRCYKIIHAYVDAIVERGFAEHDEYDPIHADDYVFLHEVINQTSDKIQIRAELLSSLLAGRDTTASLLSNVWFEIARNPSVWSRLQAEVASLEGAHPTHEQVKELKYLNAVLRESLRLYPVVPENSRTASTETTLPLGGGEDESSPVFVKKGWILHWSLWTMHRRKDIYGEDAEEFKPERWLDEGEKKGLRVGWEFLPFNGGPRICIGQQFALAEARYISARLLQEFSGIASRDPEPWREKVGLTVTGLGGCKVALTPRAHQ